MRLFSTAAIVFLIAILGISYAAPLLHDTKPINNTFISGGIKEFSINVTSINLNSSAVGLHLIAESALQQGENWDIHLLACSSTSAEWRCAKNISFAVAGSDTVELFYFRANDTDGASETSGSATSPLRLTLDRTFPTLSFINPSNNSYVNSNTVISVSASDTSSGVDNSTVQYSLDNSAWTNLTNVSATKFEGFWNTTVYSNNQTLTIYARASDKVGNNAVLKINVTADNEKPKIKILSPSTLSYTGNINLQLNANDSYSGIDMTNVKYTAESLSGTLGCTGDKYNATCTTVFDTSKLSDGNHTLNFSIKDAAGNSVWDSVTIKTDNTKPGMSITSPAASFNARGNLQVNVSLTNAQNIVSYVRVFIDRVGSMFNMSCNSDFSLCQYTLNTLQYADGDYTLKTEGINQAGFDVTASTPLVIDNTKPLMNIFFPSSSVAKGTFKIEYSATDVFAVNKDSGIFNLGTSNQTITCSVTSPGKSMICSADFNSETLSDGDYIIEVFGSDKAGNVGSGSKAIKIDNKPPYLKSITIEPLISTTPIKVKFTASLADNASAVKSAKLIVKSDAMEKTITLTKSNEAWIAASFLGDEALYKVNVNATDENNNWGLLENVGVFYLGPSTCGDATCQSYETYCTCSQDCASSKPSCGSGLVIECGSGYPKCSTQPTCGDNICSGTETCNSCSQDCGKCDDFNKKSEEEVTDEEPKEKSEFKISLPFKSEYIMIGVVLGAVAVVLVVIAVIVKQKLNKNIIQEE